MDAGSSLSKDPDFLASLEELRSLCFGPEYFRGVKWGAAVSGSLTAYIAFTSYRSCKRVVAARAKAGFRVSMWVAAPVSVATAATCGAMSVLKAAKFVASRGRYNEFAWDKYLAEECATPEEQQELAFLEEQRRLAEERDRLAREDPAQRVFHTISDQRSSDRLPTFWDGVAVGLFGSVQDAYNPQKPTRLYLNMQGGKHM